MTFYQGAVSQRGRGFGSMFGSIFRNVLVPVAKKAIIPAVKRLIVPAAKRAGRQLLRQGVRQVKRQVQGNRPAKRLVKAIGQELARAQRQQGYHEPVQRRATKRKVPSKRQKKPTNKRARALNAALT